MIGSIRKHSKWLWWVVASLTIISFVAWNTSPGTRYGSGRNAGYGVLYGKAITHEQFVAAQREFLIYYWMQAGEFPGKNPKFTQQEMDKQTYIRMMLVRKSEALGVHVSQEAMVAGANDILRSLSRNGPVVPMDEFIKRVLTPAGLDAQDFQRMVHDDLAIQQLVQTLGLSGALVPPQEASQLYDREHQEVSAQAVFFSASNYLSQVAVTPAAVGQFYSNYMAVAYRLPDRVQLNYVEWDLTNFLAAVEKTQTNINSKVESTYLQQGKELVPDAKTPEEAKAKIREMLLRQAAAGIALDKSKAFATELFAMDPVAPENLVTLAKQKDLTVHTTAPFTAAEGPAEFPAPAELVSAAVKLNADSPFGSKPIAGAESVYVFGLARQLPSAVQPLDQIHDQVVRDFQVHEAAFKARTAGTNFYFSTAVQMATGKTFAQAALAAGQAPLALKPFSLSSSAVAETEGLAEPGEIKQAAFTTQPGHVSQFMATAEGGFVLFVQTLLPVNEAEKKDKLPGYLSQIRRAQEGDAFNLWLQTEANRELRDTPIYAEMTGAAKSSAR